MENLKNVAPIEDFNWDAYENGEATSNVSHEDQEKAYDSTLNKVGDHEVVDGTVIAMNKREVVVNIGFKSDGIIPMSEFRYNPDLKVGDTVEVYIENQEDKKGQLVLSHRKARASRSWERVNAALMAMLSAVKNRILELKETGQWNKLSRAQIKEMLTNLELEKPTVDVPTVADVFIKMGEGRRERTQAISKSTALKIGKATRL